MQKQRNLYIDVLKAITIILVVLGHAIQYGAGMDNLVYGGFFYNPVFAFIYSFHMPLFMLISGYLFSCSCKQKSCTKLLFSKIKQLLIPLFFWSCIFTFLQCIKAAIGQSSQNVTIIWIFQTIYSGFKGGPWFLWAIWWCSFIIIINRKFFKDNIIIYILICLICFVVPDGNNLAVYKFMWPFFCLGYLFNKYDLKTKLSKIYTHKAFGFGCLFVFMILFSFYNYNTYIYTTGFTVLGKNIFQQIHNNCFRFLIGLVGSLSVMCIVYAFMDILPKIIKKFLAFVGTCTMGIYIISNYLFDEVVKLVAFSGLNYWCIALQTICILAVCILITFVLKKIKTANQIFLGGR